mmetsp:Transcript_81814/g.236444  ORF Transcript_81814/g.236444 Transcript_81814/m.236444 type:complete len:283 (+) Transcript_81814:230-1078(+)
MMDVGQQHFLGKQQAHGDLAHLRRGRQHERLHPRPLRLRLPAPEGELVHGVALVRHVADADDVPHRPPGARGADLLRLLPHGEVLGHHHLVIVLLLREVLEVDLPRPHGPQVQALRILRPVLRQDLPGVNDPRRPRPSLQKRLEVRREVLRAGLDPRPLRVRDDDAMVTQLASPLQVVEEGLLPLLELLLLLGLSDRARRLDGQGRRRVRACEGLVAEDVRRGEQGVVPVQDNHRLRRVREVRLGQGSPRRGAGGVVNKDPRGLPHEVAQLLQLPRQVGLDI